MLGWPNKNHRLLTHRTFQHCWTYSFVTSATAFLLLVRPIFFDVISDFVAECLHNLGGALDPTPRHKGVVDGARGTSDARGARNAGRCPSHISSMTSCSRNTSFTCVGLSFQLLPLLQLCKDPPLLKAEVIADAVGEQSAGLLHLSQYRDLQCGRTDLPVILSALPLLRGMICAVAGLVEDLKYGDFL